MCDQCLKDYGGPIPPSSEIIAAARLIEALYDLCPAGGRAHIVTDDFNITDEHIDGCLDYDGIKDETPEEREAALAALRAIRALPTLQARATAVYLAHYYGDTSDPKGGDPA